MSKWYKIMTIAALMFSFTACGVDSTTLSLDVAEDGQAVSGAAVSGGAVSSSAITMQMDAVNTPIPEQNGKGNKDSKKKKIVTVTDETGEKRKLKLGDIDVSDMGSYFHASNPTGRYAQVVDGHFYYLQSDGQRNYTIFQDNGNVVGDFSLEKGYVSDFLIYHSNYYAIIVVENDWFQHVEGQSTFLARIDLENKGIEKLIKNLGDENLQGDCCHTYMSIYNEQIYYDNRRDTGDIYYSAGKHGVVMRVDKGWYVSEYYYGAGKSMIVWDMNDMEQEREFSSPTNMIGANPYLTFCDGKILYGRQKGREVRLYCYDLQTQKEKEFFRYKRNKSYKNSESTNQGIILSIDDEYIYCQDFAIPREGGKMQRILKDAIEYDDGVLAFASNKNYIYYLDKNYQVHRISKDTKKDIVICNEKMMSVYCTDQYVYTREYADHLMPDYDDGWDDEGCDYEEQEEDEPYFSSLYCMDLDGKNRSEIWKYR